MMTSIVVELLFVFIITGGYCQDNSTSRTTEVHGWSSSRDTESRTTEWPNGPNITTNANCLQKSENSDGRSGIIRSNNGGIYRNFMDCDWTVQAPRGQNIRLTFDSFNLEYNFDFLRIHDCNGALITRYTGFQNITSCVIDYDCLLLRFTSDNTIGRSGFQLTYEYGNYYDLPCQNESITTLTTSTASPQTECGGNLTGSAGVITSPNYPNFYMNNAQCHWRIQTETDQIRLRFDVFDTEISFDIMFVYDCNGNEKARFDGHRSREVYVFHGRCMDLRFYSDGSITRPGFIINYAVVA